VPKALTGQVKTFEKLWESAGGTMPFLWLNAGRHEPKPPDSNMLICWIFGALLGSLVPRQRRNCPHNPKAVWHLKAPLIGHHVSNRRMSQGVDVPTSGKGEGALMGLY
jgi:hypothetical protein